jgi:hypothetical protein
MWYALFINGILYSVSKFAEMASIDICVLNEADRVSGVSSDITVRFVTQQEAARLASYRNHRCALAA